MDLVSSWSGGVRFVLVRLGGGREGLAHVPPGDGGFESIKVVYSHSRSSQIDAAHVTRLGTLLEICINNLFATLQDTKKQIKENGKRKTERAKEQIH